MKQLKTIMAASLALVAGTALADNINGVNIDFVNIGNAGNVADGNGYGSVGYDYRIGTTEVTIDQFAPSGVGDGGEGFWSTLASNEPVSFVSWHEAAQYCNWLTSGNANNGAYTIAGNLVTAVDRASAVASYGMVYVMPTEDEWYKAAYFTGSGYSLYANGTGTAPVDGVDSLYAAAGGYGGPAWGAGSGTAEQSGTFDMMGNLWEWTESAFDGTLDNIGEKIAFRGGDYYLGLVKLGSGNRESDVPTAEWSSIGMRIVAIPEPGTISLMSLSTLGLFVTRRFRRRKQAGKTLFPIGREHSCDTFGTKDLVEEDTDSLDELMLMVKAQLSEVWENVHAWHAGVEKVFWNRMVATHDRRVARKAAFKVAFKKKALDGLDTFLARIMK